MKNLAHAFLLVAFGLLSHAAGATTIVITVGDNFYSPQTVSIHPGDVVTWQYQGGTNSHPTVSDTNAWTSFTINSANVSKSLTFATTGAFPYHCSFHGAPGVGMYGVITVAAALPVLPTQLATEALAAYPNPATGSVTLRLNQAQARAHHVVQFLNLLGSVVRTVEVGPEAVGHDLAISLADLPTGIYCYRLLVNDQVVATQRLVLTH